MSERVMAIKSILKLSAAAVFALAAIFFAVYEFENWNLPLTNEQVVQQIAYCKAHGLKAEIFTEPFNDGEIHAIQCFPEDYKP